jgi:hypothetical protein
MVKHDRYKVNGLIVMWVLEHQHFLLLHKVMRSHVDPIQVQDDTKLSSDSGEKLIF